MCGFSLGYAFYARRIARLFEIDIHRPTPAVAGKKTALCTFIPGVFMFLTTIGALAIQSVSYGRSGQHMLLLISIALICLAFIPPSGENPGLARG